MKHSTELHTLKWIWTSWVVLLSVNVFSQAKLNFDSLYLINHNIDTIEVSDFGKDNLFLVVSKKSCIGCEVFLSSNLNITGAILIPNEFLTIPSVEHLINSQRNFNIKNTFVLIQKTNFPDKNELSPSLILQSDKSLYYYDYETLKQLTKNFKKTKKLIRSIDKLKEDHLR